MRLYRPHIPLDVRLRVVNRQLGFPAALVDGFAGAAKKRRSIGADLKGDYPLLDLWGMGISFWLGQAGALLLTVFVLLVTSGAAFAMGRSIPVVPCFAASPANFLTMGVNPHAHPASMTLSSEEVLVLNVGNENVVVAQTQKRSDIGILPRPDDKIVVQFFPDPISLFPSFGKIGPLQEFITDLSNESWHSSSVYHSERQCGVTIAKANGVISVEDVSALGRLQIRFAAPYSEPSDNGQAIGKIGDQKISEPRFVAKPEWQQSIEIRIVGFLLIVGGLFLLKYEHFIYFVGATAVMLGIFCSLYGPDAWFLWSAQ
jgi:hypothetical protein